MESKMESKITTGKNLLWKYIYKQLNLFLGLKQLVSDHVNSFDQFIDQGLRDMSTELQHVKIKMSDEENGKGAYLQVWFENFYLEKPEKVRRDASFQGSLFEPRTFPRECRETGETYSGNLMSTVCHKIVGSCRDNPVHKNIIKICSFPIMVASHACHLESLDKIGLIKHGEEDTESGGYFIVNGIERIIRLLIQQRRHYVLGLVRSSFLRRGALFSKFATSIRCVDKTEISSTIRLHYMKTGSARLGLTIERQEFYIPVGIVIRAITDSSEKEIFMNSDYRCNSENCLINDCIINCLHEATDADILSKMDALRYIGKYFRNLLRGQKFVSDVELGEFFIARYIFTHLKRQSEKANLLLFMLQKLTALVQGLCKPDNPDTLAHQEIMLPGSLLQGLLYEKMEHVLEQIRLKFQALFDVSYTDKVEALEPNSIQNSILQVIQKYDIGRHFEYFLATGNLVSKSGLGLSQSSGFTIVADKLNYLRFLSHFRSVHRGAYFTELRTTTIRKLLPESWGFLCPIHTPDGSPCGLLNHLAGECKIVVAKTRDTDFDLVRKTVKKSLGLNFEFTNDSNRENLESLLPVLLDGLLIGSLHERDAANAVRILRRAKVDSSSYIPRDLEIAHVTFRKGGVYPGIYIFSSSSRLVRPVLQTSGGNVELIGTLEQSFMSIKTQDGENRDFCKSFKYSHEEIYPDSFLSAVASLTPWSDYNRSPRNMYQCQMGKQTMGVPMHSFPFRSDSKLYRLHTPQRPIALTKTYDKYGIDNYPLGTNAVVAVLSYTGYDMEDAMIMNKFSMERGLAHATLYKTEGLTLKDKNDTFTVSGPLNQTKFDASPLPGSILQKGDSFISVSNRISGKLKKTMLKGEDKGIVDRVKISASQEQSSYEKLDVTLRFNRNPIIGDKFSSRHGQKGVLSYLWPEEDLPFIERNGIKPDIIINPHAFPSRMTIGMLMESLASKEGALSGNFVDASPFKALKEEHLTIPLNNHYERLKDMGYKFTGTETMINGFTGCTFEVDIFIGLVYYQRLRHMVSDKFQVRSEGPNNPLTKQPIKGRKMGGGIRFGEMERDSLLSHGVANLIQDRLLASSDKHSFKICSSCGSMISHLQKVALRNEECSNDICITCRSTSNIVNVHVPYVYKYLISELAAMNIRLCADLND